MYQSRQLGLEDVNSSENGKKEKNERNMKQRNLQNVVINQIEKERLPVCEHDNFGNSGSIW